MCSYPINAHMRCLESISGMMTWVIYTCSALAGQEAKEAAQTEERIGNVVGLQAVAQLRDNAGHVAPLC